MKKKIAVLGCAWSVYFVKEFLQGLQNTAKELNADIYYFNAYNFVEFSGFPNYTGFAVYNLINYEEYDGIIVLSDLISNQRVLERERLRIIKSGKPAFAINKKLEGLSFFRVDNYSGAYELMSHLIKEHGYKDFAYITGKETAIDIAERYKAYRVALQDNNIKINMDNVFEIENCSYYTAYNFFKNYLKEGKPLPEVFVCANDLIASAILKNAEENNIKVPEQLKVVGYDDIYYAKSIIPSITTVNNNVGNVASEVLKQLLSPEYQLKELSIKSTPVFRNTCGCESQIASEQKLFNLSILDNLNQSEEFSSQLEKIEEIFTEASDVFTLLTNLDILFANSHKFEGSDFCIYLRSDWANIMVESVENLPQNLSFGSQVQSIISIQGDKKFLREFIETKQLMPSKMQAGESNLYIFMPIYNHSFVFGYYVAKNNLAMIDNRFGYTWTKTFGTCLERFRKKNMYKQMSQQFLKLSTRDSLSGMLNRVGLEKLAKPFYAQNKKNGLTSVLFFVDINKMKHINDNFGHLHGDLAVKTIAAAVMEVVPKNWLPIRYGGDEFLVVGNSKNYNGEDYCTMIQQRVAKKTSVMHLPYNLSASVGTYSVPPNSTLSLEEAVEKVDEIMYAQKEQMHKMMENQSNQIVQPNPGAQ